jgi:hypothetical protein
MSNMLSNLNHSSPSMMSEFFLTIVTLLEMFIKFDGETFLNINIIGNLIFLKLILYYLYYA